MLGKVQLMNMNNFSFEIWTMHRKIFHRFLKYQKYFTRATSNLPEYHEVEVVKEEPAAVGCADTSVCCPKCQPVICLLSSSDGEVSEDDNDEETDSDDGVTHV